MQGCEIVLDDVIETGDAAAQAVEPARHRPPVRSSVVPPKP
jgi:hypothetical protein